MPVLSVDVCPNEDCSLAVETLAFDDVLCEPICGWQKENPINMNAENQPKIVFESKIATMIVADR